MRSLLIILALFGADHGELGGEGSQLSKINCRYYLFDITSPGSRWARTVIIHRAGKINGPYEGRIALDDRGIAQGGSGESILKAVPQEVVRAEAPAIVVAGASTGRFHAADNFYQNRNN